MRYRPDIDGLRAVAVVAVVIFHAFPGWAPGGFVGVDVFFVISGFLISTIILESARRGTFSFSEFYRRRIRRIFPALFLIVAATLVFGWLVLLPFEYEALGKHSVASAVFLLNAVLLQESGYFDKATAFKPLMHLWSLAIEEQFYLVWPWLLVLFVRGRRSVLALVLVILGVSLASWALFPAYGHGSFSFYSPLTRFWELMAGCLLAYLTAEATVAGLGQPVVEGLWALGFLMIVIPVVRFSESSIGWLLSIVPVAGAAIALGAGARSVLARRILGWRPLVAIGLISYPLYLWHWPLIAFANIVQAQLAPRGVRIALVAVAGLLAWLTYEWVEKPIRAARGRRGALAAWILLALVSGAGLMGLAVYRTGGFPERVDPADRTYAESVPSTRAEYVAGGTSSANVPSGGPARQIAVFGDSHSGQVYNALSRLGGSRVVAFTHGTCLPFRGVHTYRRPTVLQVAETDCQPWVNETLDALRDSPDVAAVVIASYYNVYLDGRLKVTYEGHDGMSALEIFRTAARRTVDELVARGKKIVLVADVPEFSEPCLPKRPHFFRSQAACEMPAAPERERSAAFLSVFNELATVPGVSVFDPRAAFCNQESCFARSADSYWYNADGNHLTSAGAQVLLEGFRASAAWRAVELPVR